MILVGYLIQGTHADFTLLRKKCYMILLECASFKTWYSTTKSVSRETFNQMERSNKMIRNYKKVIEILSKQESEDKYLTATETDCDGDYSYPMDDKQIKESYIGLAEHRDLFIQVIEHRLEQIKEELKEDMSKDEKLVRWGIFAGYNAMIKDFYDVHNAVENINQEYIARKEGATLCNPDDLKIYSKINEIKGE